MDWLEAVGLIIKYVVMFMQHARFWHEVTLWHIFISICALGLAVTLFKMFFGANGGDGGKGGVSK